MARYLIFCVTAIVASGCCSQPVQVFDVPPRPVFAEFTDEEFDDIPMSVLHKLAEETQQVQNYIDKVEARARLINEQ